MRRRRRRRRRKRKNIYLKTKDIVKGKIKPEDLKDSYIFVQEDTHDHQIALAVNIFKSEI
jgi:hypothetical protein